MKSLWTALLIGVILLSGCRRDPGRSESQAEPSPTALARSIEAEEDSALYLGLIRRLDFLLEGADWQSPDQLDKPYLTQWYLRQWILTQGDGGEFQISPLFSADGDGLLFPAQEVEETLEAWFGVNADWLREDNPTYRPEEGGYRTIGAAGDLRQYEIDLLSAREENGILTLTFTLESGGGQSRQTKELTVDRTGTLPRYLSLVTLR